MIGKYRLPELQIDSIYDDNFKVELMVGGVYGGGSPDAYNSFDGKIGF